MQSFFQETSENQENRNLSYVLMSTAGEYLVFANVIRKQNLWPAAVKIVQQHVLNALFSFDPVLKGIHFLIQMATDLICPSGQNCESHGKSNLNSKYLQLLFKIVNVI